MGDLNNWQKLALWIADHVPKNKLTQDTAYKIISDRQVGFQAGATKRDVVRNMFSSKPKDEDTNKYMFVYGADTRRPETTIGQAYDWSKDIKENGYENVKTYRGVLNPYNEYLVDSRNKGLVEEFAKVGYSPVSNINNEYIDWNTYRLKQGTPYFDDVHSYRPTFHFNNGQPVISSSDLYDFGKNYVGDFADLYAERSGSEKDPAFTMELQRRALNAVGQPYRLVQKNIPIRFVDNPQGNEIWRTNNFNKELRLDEMSDREISDILHTGYIEPAVVTAYKKGGRIHIKKKNRGSFTRWCNGKVTEECIRRGKNSSNPAIRKKSVFAANARKWKHENGGILKAQEGTGNLLTPHPLSPVGIALNQAKAMAKMKGEQQHLPLGVKEIVGPDGKKVAIRTEQPLVPLEQNIAEWLPGTGDVAEVGYIADDVKNGNLGSATLAAAMVALPGNVGKVLRKSDIPASKLTEAERLGIPKGERNQPAKAPTKSQTYKKTANLESDKDYLEDIEAIQQGFLGKTFLDSEHETLLDWFNSPQYKERLVKQGFSEEQINNLLSNIKDKLSRKNLKYAVDLNSIREWGIGSGGALKIDPQLYPAYEAMTNGNIKIGGQPINWSLIQLKKGVNLDEMIPHEVGGHHLESLVAEFNAPYTSQQITDMGKKAAISSGLPEGYYPSWWETRARALTIAKQMKEAGWNPNSPEQVNVWLNKHLLKDHNTNVVQGALYYDRPGFVKAVSEGLKNGGKL